VKLSEARRKASQGVSRFAKVFAVTWNKLLLSAHIQHEQVLEYRTGNGHSEDLVVHSARRSKVVRRA
jgi:hypothetical protein